MKKSIICLWCNKEFDQLPKNNICPKCGYSHFDHCILDIKDDHKGLSLKLGNSYTLKSMLNGTIWFQSPKYYQNYKGNQAIGDINECAWDNIEEIPLDQVEDILSLKIGKAFIYEDKELVLKEIQRAKVCTHSKTQNYNRLLCFYILHINNDNTIIKPDNKLKNFGDSFSLINVEGLSNCIYDYATKIGLSCYPTFVKYITKNYHGVYNPTLKDDSFFYQNEFRIILRGKELNELPELKEKIFNLESDVMKDFMTLPQPIEKLFESNSVKEIFELFNLEMEENI